MATSKIPEIVRKHEAQILEEWLALQQSSVGVGSAERRSSAAGFLRHFTAALQHGSTEVGEAAWADTRSFLGDLSRSQARLGAGPTETAWFVLSLKQPIFGRLRAEIRDPGALGEEVWTATRLLDALGLYTTEVFQRGREDVIARQQQELLELSTPVTRLWEGVLAVPLIGTLDSARTQVVMESLLEEVVRSGASIAVIDITGVPAVDTLVAQHLLKTVSAAKLMGAECVISGIRPQIAQTVVHLGVDLGGVVTKATLADAFRYALGRLGLRVVAADDPDGERRR
ncbi:MAG TPA: RsbRD N-terminal domain-containing protein [Gammaproteobacteria bacterium]